MDNIICNIYAGTQASICVHTVCNFRVNLPGSFEIGRQLFQRRVRSAYIYILGIYSDRREGRWSSRTGG